MAKFRIEIPKLIQLYQESESAMIMHLENGLKDKSLLDQLSTYSIISADLRKREKFQMALSTYKKTMELIDTLSLVKEKADCHVEMGICLRNLGYSQEAGWQYEAAIPIFEETQDQEGLSLCYNNLGVVAYSYGKFEEALNFYSKAVSIDEKMANPVEVAVGWMNQAMCHGMLGRLRQSITWYEKALDVLKDTNRIKSIIRCMLSMGASYYRLGEYEKSTALLKEALQNAQAIESPVLEAKCHNNLANILIEQEQYRLAIEHLEKAVKLTNSTQHKSSMAKSIAILGFIHSRLGEWDKALAHQKENLLIVKSIGNQYGEAAAHGNLGVLYAAQQKYKEAGEMYAKTIELFKEIGDNAALANAYFNLGNAHYKMNNYQIAEEMLLKANKINDQQVNGKLLRANCALLLGNVYLETQRNEEGLKHQELAFQLGTELGAISLVQNVYMNLMKYEVLQDDLNKAYEYGQKAIKIADQTYEDLLEEQHLLYKAGELSQHYTIVLLISLELKYWREALQFLERSKSRALISILKGTNLYLTKISNSTAQKLYQKEQDVLGKIKQLQFRHFNDNEQMMSPGHTDQLRASLLEIYSELDTIDPVYVALRRGRVLTFEEIKKILNAKPKLLI